MITEQMKQQIVNVLSDRVSPAFIILFGSQAKGTARTDSDIDLAYYAENLLSPYERFLLAGELARVAQVDVDVVNIREIDTVFAMQVFSTGKVLACQDEDEFVKQRMWAFSMYAELNEQRADVLLSIQGGGSVFGDE